ncbi:uncharacterized protein PV09_01619 [Verruconis gallopava]|uniref:Short-chain dehydrogenase/reductase 3 n=1 Tax=Verruconis gallopava TaxID=253628 RepID=A0A0D2B8U3_9PEZI|nr:uncharacterized protein PV09_01619 [Verruconis gallopava]KIW07679.1 hypothetical protein PV09_01619 [Verruconis gallopava]
MTDPIRVVRPPRIARKTESQPWHTYFTVDVLYAAARKTILHPFVAWIIPLCLRAVTVPYDDISMQLSIGYACLLTLLWVLSVLNNRIAYGIPREVDYDEEVIIITGGASGLGRLIADFYVMRGASVAVLDLKQADDDEFMGIRYYQCDIGDKKQVDEAITKIKTDLGTPTILVNNAGVMHSKSILDLDPEEIELTLRVNLLSHWHTVKACLPGMLEEERGTIVTVASVLGYLGCPNLSAYTATKAGLLAFHQSLTAELSQTPEIKTILVAPGQLDTPMFKGMNTPSNFLAPVVAPVELAKEIVNMIDSGWSGEICLPLYTRVTPLIPALPAAIQKILKALSGMDKAILDFTAARKKES